MPDPLIYGFDTETHLMGPGSVIPRIVCASFCGEGEEPLVVARDHGVKDILQELLTSEVVIVAHRACFDLAVVCREWPDLYPLVWSALESGRIKDTEVREKLLNLSRHGKLRDEVLPDGSTSRLLYSLADVLMAYGGPDKREQKERTTRGGGTSGAGDSWRLNFASLDGMHESDYPAEAYAYAAEDAEDALWVYKAQQAVVASGEGTVETEDLHVAASFALQIITGIGMRIDPAERERVERMLREELAPEKLPLLYEHGILRPAEPPRPFASGAKNPDGTPKLTAPKPESVNTSALKELVLQTAMSAGVECPRTEKGAISTESAFLESIQEHSPILQQYVARQALMKLVTTELPRMRADRVHFNYNVLLETGRTSSSAGTLYPSANGQNIDPRAKGCYIPEDGWVLLSSDYATQELVTLAQKCYTLFGASVLRDVINRGVDTHAYLASVLAAHLDPQFGQQLRASGISDRWAVLETFLAARNGPPEAAAWFKKWRKFAKPVNLGFPGGLGPETFVKYAFAQGVKTTLEEAHVLRDLWRQAYPEMPLYHEWVNSSCPDPAIPEAYAYRSPFGMIRRGASFCAAANGSGLQTPSAEASKAALIGVVRACTDPSCGSPLLGCLPANFIHDEIMVQIPEDRWMHERALEVKRIMEEAMQIVTPDVRVLATPCLMRKWSKDAEPVYDNKGRLLVWEPKQETLAA